MSEKQIGMLDRRTAMKAMGASSLIGLPGILTSSERQDQQGEGMDCIPGVYIPIIDAYYNGEVIWFIHTSASTEQMATRLEEMIDYPVLHVPKLNEIADIDKLGNIYVFKNGVDQSDTEPWGGGPFGYQIDILDSVPGDEEYTPLRNPHMVMWHEDANPEIIESVDQLKEAEQAGRLSINQTDVVVNAPVVEWPDGGFGNIMGIDDSDMTENCPMCGMMNESRNGDTQNRTMTENNSSSSSTDFP